MDRIIRQITEDLITRLPEGPKAYQIQELHTCGFPPFLVQRIFAELEQKLAESMILPKTDWANTESEAVQQSWQHFLNAIEAEAHLPASYARAVIETAVADTMAILVQPRKSIPNLLFDDADTLTTKELARRCERLVIYTHFSKVLMSYVKRKKLDVLQKERCKEIISRVDARLTSQYTPLQWAQMLDPLFVLVGKEMDTDLLRLFFEDKNKSRTARKFDLMDATITRAKLIEVLSSPDLLNFQGYEPDQSELFGGEDRAEELSDSEPATLSDRFIENAESVTEDEREQKTDMPLTDGISETNSPAEAEPEEPELNQAEALTEPEEKDVEEPLFNSEEEQPMENEEETPHSLNDMFFSDEDEEPEETSESDISNEQKQEAPFIEDTPAEAEHEAPEPFQMMESSATENEQKEDAPSYSQGEQYMEFEEEAVYSLNDMFVDKEDKGVQDIAEPEVDKEQERVQDQTEMESEGNDEIPIWQRFVGPNESNEEAMEETTVNVADGEGPSKRENDLEILLQTNKSYFIHELFSGSEQSYKRSLAEVARKKNWKAACKLIKEDIFERNNVNIYSEAAVDFIDELQAYFLRY